MTKLTSGAVYAYLSSAWVNINPDVLATGVSGSWGIPGNGPLDRLANAGSLRFTLSNRTGEYAPDSATALTDWGKGTAVKLVLTYGGDDYTRFYGRVDGINIRNGLTVNDNYVDVVVLDWLDYATKYPVTNLQTLADRRANQGVSSILASMPIQPQGWSQEIGVNLFPSLFDSATIDTRAYTEFSKLVKSELGYLYLRKDKTFGETLKLEANDTRNGLNTLKQIPVAIPATSYLLQENGDFLLQENGDKIILDVSPTMADASITGGIMDATLKYGDMIINRVTAQAFPKRIDIEDTVLYSLGNPMPIAPGEIITFRAQYTDPDGGNRVNAQNGTMITPEVAGAADPYLASLLHFNGADSSTTFTDETGKTWTAHNGAVISTTVSQLGGGVGSFSGTNEYIDTPSHADFDFGSGDFTVEWFAYLKDATSGDCTLARDGVSNYPSWAFGFSDGTELNVYLTSTGTSWNAAYPKTFGKVSLNSWVHYAITRQGNVFRTFRDGQLQDTWIDSITLVSSTGSPCVGRVNNTKYQFVYVDELRITKGQCRYSKNFVPTSIQFTGTLPGDYLANTLEDGSGTDLTPNIVIAATYGSEAVEYTLTNTSGKDGFITYLTARGRGIYQYNPIELTLTDSASIASYGYQDLKIDQMYQEDLQAAAREAGKILDRNKQPHTNLRSITLSANRSNFDMALFLNTDIGDLIEVTDSNSGIDSRYYVNSFSFNVAPGGIISYTLGTQQAWSLTKGLTAMMLELSTGGTASAVEFGSIPQISNLQHITVSAWVYLTNIIANNRTILAHYSDAAGYNFYVSSASGRLVMYQKGTAGPGWWYTNNAIAIDGWYHVVYTRDTTLPTNEAVFYINGALEASVEGNAQNGAIADDSLCNTIIGNTHTATQDYPSPLHGKVKDVRIYNNIQTAAQVAALYAASAYDMTNTTGMVFQAPCVRTKELTAWTDHTMTADDRILDNVYGVTGAPHGNSVIIRTV